jgi:hypothetical protein
MAKGSGKHFPHQIHGKQTERLKDGPDALSLSTLLVSIYSAGKDQHRIPPVMWPL